MKKNKKLNIKSILGYIILLLGLAIIAYPLINRSLADRNSKKTLEEYIKTEKAKSPSQKEEEVKKASEYNKLVENSDTSILDPFTTDQNENSYNYYKNSDEIFAYLIIPKLDKNLPIYLDATLHHISLGVAQVSGSSIPIGGKGERTVIAGHRDWWTDTMLLYADDLESGDYVYIKRGDTTLRYRVDNKQVIGPYDWDKLEKVEGKDMLTLLTCHPFAPPRTDRLLINCLRDEEIEVAKADQTDKIADETDMANKEIKDIENLPISSNDSSKKSKGSQKINLITKIGAILVSLAFVLVLLNFIKRIIISLNKNR